uniref:Uncharacterized protein n=1 Tax=Ditylenchus dipsaci TaxID=166011 RepID=A0A915DHF2_9BILA
MRINPALDENVDEEPAPEHIVPAPSFVADLGSNDNDLPTADTNTPIVVQNPSRNGNNTISDISVMTPKPL